jgi:hypothetical protein
MRNLRTDKSGIWGLAIRNPVTFTGYMMCSISMMFFSLHRYGYLQDGLCGHIYNLTPVFIGFGVGLILGSRSMDWRMIVGGGALIAIIYYYFANIYLGG